MDQLDVEKVASELPAELVAVLKVAGLAKVASNLTGVPCESETAVYSKIGTELFLRRKESAQIRRGLQSLAELQGA